MPSQTWPTYTGAQSLSVMQDWSSVAASTVTQTDASRPTSALEPAESGVPAPASDLASLPAPPASGEPFAVTPEALPPHAATRPARNRARCAAKKDMLVSAELGIARPAHC